MGMKFEEVMACFKAIDGQFDRADTPEEKRVGILELSDEEMIEGLDLDVAEVQGSCPFIEDEVDGDEIVVKQADGKWFACGWLMWDSSLTFLVYDEELFRRAATAAANKS